jgi:hypothetical protein
MQACESLTKIIRSIGTNKTANAEPVFANDLKLTISELASLKKGVEKATVELDKPIKIKYIKAIVSMLYGKFDEAKYAGLVEEVRDIDLNNLTISQRTAITESLGRRCYELGGDDDGNVVLLDDEEIKYMVMGGIIYQILKADIDHPISHDFSYRISQDILSHWGKTREMTFHLSCGVSERDNKYCRDGWWRQKKKIYVPDED